MSDVRYLRVSLHVVGSPASPPYIRVVYDFGLVKNMFVTT